MLKFLIPCHNSDDKYSSYPNDWLLTNLSYDLHLWRMIRTHQSRSWRRMRRIRAWRQCTGWHGWGPQAHVQVSQGVKSSSRDLQWGKHVRHLRRTRLPIGWQRSFRQTWARASGIWCTCLRRGRTGGWWECLKCRIVWWGRKSTVHDNGQTWLVGQHGSPEIII